MSHLQCAFETELASVSMTAKQLESQPVAGSDWTVFHASLRLLQAIGNSKHWLTVLLLLDEAIFLVCHFFKVWLTIAFF